MENKPLLSVQDLTARYGPVQVLRSISFQLRQQRCLSVLGINGAGKSTLLRALAGIGVVRTGSVLLEGRDLARCDSHQIVDSGVSLVPEGRQLFPTLTVIENLEMGGLRLHRSGRSAEVSEALGLVWEHFPRLYERREQKVGTLSGGEQQMVAIGRAMTSKPSILMLDEPSVGLAPQVIEALFNVFQSLKRSGLSIILAEQNVRLALDLADDAILLDLGTIAVSGAKDELAGSSIIESVYFGKVRPN